jgi:hypothetical protein
MIVVFVAVIVGPMVVMVRVIVMILAVRVRPSFCVRPHQPELGGRHTGLEHTVGRQIGTRWQQGTDRLAQPVEWQARVQKRAENHVARGTRETIEVQKLHRTELYNLSCRLTTCARCVGDRKATCFAM